MLLKIAHKSNIPNVRAVEKLATLKLSWQKFPKRLGKEVILTDVAYCLQAQRLRLGSIWCAKNLEDNGVQLAFGQTVQAIEGESKVELL